eukprot:SAG11_NODE_790_length_7155_cov_217.330641_2_plen_349_part_00
MLALALLLCLRPAYGGNVHAVIVSTSRYWFNYRHSANALGIYSRLREGGVPDSNIVLMLADDHACDPRNVHRGQLYNDQSQSMDLYKNVHVDYRGNDVSVGNFLKVLSGRHSSTVPSNRKLLSDERSDLLLYLTGHGGDEFIKFRDFEELTAKDLAIAISQMRAQKRYRRVLLLADTCEAATLATHIEAPEVAFYSSSLRHENSYSHHADFELGVLVTDRFTHHLLRHARTSVSLARLIDQVGAEDLMSHVGMKSSMSISTEKIEAAEFLRGKRSTSVSTAHGYFSALEASLATARLDMCSHLSKFWTQHRAGACCGQVDSLSKVSTGKVRACALFSVGFMIITMYNF